MVDISKVILYKYDYRSRADIPFNTCTKPHYIPSFHVLGYCNSVDIGTVICTFVYTQIHNLTQISKWARCNKHLATNMM